MPTWEASGFRGCLHFWHYFFLLRLSAFVLRRSPVQYAQTGELDSYGNLSGHHSKEKTEGEFHRLIRQTGSMQIPSDDDARLRIAEEAFDFIEREVRPFLAAGGRLWSKGSRGYPSKIRQMFLGLDKAHGVTFATRDAMLVDSSQRQIEHVVPVKRIVIEIVDPGQADPRSNSRFDALAGGPAMSPKDLISVFDRLLVKCWVTADEHDRLNRAGRSMQWDAPDGDGWTRYRLAGVTAYRLTASGDLLRD